MLFRLIRDISPCWVKSFGAFGTAFKPSNGSLQTVKLANASFPLTVLLWCYCHLARHLHCITTIIYIKWTVAFTCVCMVLIKSTSFQITCYLFNTCLQRQTESSDGPTNGGAFAGPRSQPAEHDVYHTPKVGYTYFTVQLVCPVWQNDRLCPESGRNAFTLTLHSITSGECSVNRISCRSQPSFGKLNVPKPASVTSERRTSFFGRR